MHQYILGSFENYGSSGPVVKVTQSCPTLCDPMDYTVYGILQARILEWVAIPFSRGSSWPRDWTQVPCIAGGLELESPGFQGIRILKKLVRPEGEGKVHS